MSSKPKARSAEEIHGFEFDWLASDASGHVAFFSTAGGGYAPSEFLRDTSAHDAAIDAILTMAPRTKARFAPQLPSGLQNTWQLMAERGVFAFDSNPNGGAYRLVAAPENPIPLVDLPKIAAGVASRLALRNLQFTELLTVDRSLLEP